MQTATSIPNLKTITGTPNETAILLGAANPGDGGGGTFYYDSSSSSTENDGTIVKPTAVLGNGRWLRIYSDTVNVKWFSAKVVSGNWSPAFQAALNVGRSIIVPNGSYRIDTTLTNSRDVSIFGETIAAELNTSNDINILDFKSDSTTNSAQISISNLTFYSAAAQATGSAIKLTWGTAGARRLGAVTNVRIISNPASFKYGIRVQNPQELVLRDIVIEGTPSLTAIDFTTDRSCISPTLENIKVYTANIALQVNNTGSGTAGIEGIKVFGCDFVGVDKGVVLDNTHGGPGFNLTSCHINATTGCVSLTSIQEIFITDTLFYLNGTGPNTYGIKLENVYHGSIAQCQFYRINSGAPYGVLCNGAVTTNINVVNNYFELKPTGSETAIWFGNNSSRNKALYNNVLGLSAGFDVVNGGSNNVTVGNIKY